MIAILGGLGAAVCWATATLASSRSARQIGAFSTVGGVMLVGLLLAVPAVVLSGPVQLTAEQLALLAAAGASNVLGLLLVYTALRSGKVSVVAPINSTEGGIGAVLAIIAGEQLAPGTGPVLAALVVGVVLAASERDRSATAGARFGPMATALFALAAAASFGLGLYLSGRIGRELPVAWVVLPARLVGTAVIALPLLWLKRLRITRRALPLVLVTGVAEVVGIASFALGAREAIAVASVTSSQFAGMAALGGVALFRERLSRVQIVGAVIITVGVALLSVLRAA